MKTAKYVKSISVKNPVNEKEIHLNVFMDKDGRLFALEENFFKTRINQETYLVINNPYNSRWKRKELLTLIF